MTAAPPRIAVVTLYDAQRKGDARFRKSDALSEAAIANKQHYAEYHGYAVELSTHEDVAADRPVAWSKVCVVVLETTD